MALIRFVLSFAISFLILCIPVSKVPLFYHLHQKVSPYTSKVFGLIKKEGERKLENGREISLKHFLNSLPKQKNLKSQNIESSLTPEEKEILKQVMAR